MSSMELVYNRLSIIFDLGGVLIDWNPRHLYRKLFKDDPESMEWFLSNICTHDWNLKLDAGRPFTEAIDELSDLYPQYEELIRAYGNRWEEMIAGPIEPSIDILRALRREKYQLYALSNWSVETFSKVRSRFDFLDWFETIIISGEVRVAKPDPEIFSILLQRIEKTAGECLFIDDSKINVAAAEKLGFKGIYFQSPEQLYEELCRMGIALE
jgi:2-haloacid dehalogenase